MDLLGDEFVKEDETQKMLKRRREKITGFNQVDKILRNRWLPFTFRSLDSIPSEQVTVWLGISDENFSDRLVVVSNMFMFVCMKYFSFFTLEECWCCLNQLRMNHRFLNWFKNTGLSSFSNGSTDLFGRPRFHERWVFISTPLTPIKDLKRKDKKSKKGGGKKKKKKKKK